MSNEFRVGERVHLVDCLFGEPGRVVGVERGRVLIHWPGLEKLGRHKPERVIHAVDDVPRAVVKKAHRSSIQVGER